MSPEQIVFFGVATMPLVFGLVQVAKTAGLPSRFAGLLAIILGMGIGLLAALSTETLLPSGIMQGLLAGLGASGAWSVGTHFGEMRQTPPPDEPPPIQPKRRGIRR